MIRLPGEGCQVPSAWGLGERQRRSDRGAIPWPHLRRFASDGSSKQDARLIGAGIVEEHRGAVGHTISLDHLKPHLLVEKNRLLVHRRGDGMRFQAAQRLCRSEEPLIHPPAQALQSGCGRHADEMDIGDSGRRLRLKSNQKAHRLAVFFGKKTHWGKVLEKEPGKKTAHRTTAPPGIDLGGDALIISRFEMPNWYGAQYPCPSKSAMTLARQGGASLGGHEAQLRLDLFRQPVVMAAQHGFQFAVADIADRFPILGLGLLARHPTRLNPGQIA